MKLIVHLSDLHFNPQQRQALTAQGALHAVQKVLESEYPEGLEAADLVISGDVTTKGNPQGYTAASASLYKFVKSLTFESRIVVPGNHDIGKLTGREFTDFNKFAFGFTNDPQQMFTAAQHVTYVATPRVEYFLVNSSYHCDYRYGHAPLDALENLLSAHPDGGTKSRLLVAHHSPISSDFGGNAIHNAYPLLLLCQEHKIEALLHGHIHTDQFLTVGSSPTRLLGTGSLSFDPGSNMKNQFAIHCLDDSGVLTTQMYTYSADTRSFRKDARLE